MNIITSENIAEAILRKANNTGRVTIGSRMVLLTLTAPCGSSIPIRINPNPAMTASDIINGVRAILSAFDADQYAAQFDSSELTSKDRARINMQAHADKEYFNIISSRLHSLL